MVQLGSWGLSGIFLKHKSTARLKLKSEMLEVVSDVSGQGIEQFESVDVEA